MLISQLIRILSITPHTIVAAQPHEFQKSRQSYIKIKLKSAKLTNSTHSSSSTWYFICCEILMMRILMPNLIHHFRFLADPGISVQPIDQFHLIRTQFKIINVSVLLNSFRMD